MISRQITIRIITLAITSISPIPLNMLDSSSGSIPNQLLNFEVISFVGMNSISAIDLSWVSMASALRGIFIFHFGMNTKNYNRFTKFHKYFRPKDKIIFTTRLNIATLFMPYSATS